MVWKRENCDICNLNWFVEKDVFGIIDYYEGVETSVSGCFNGNIVVYKFCSLLCYLRQTLSFAYAHNVDKFCSLLILMMWITCFLVLIIIFSYPYIYSETWVDDWALDLRTHQTSWTKCEYIYDLNNVDKCNLFRMMICNLLTIIMWLTSGFFLCYADLICVFELWDDFWLTLNLFAE